MTSRDKKLATALGVVGVGGAGFVGHQLVVAPIQENEAEYTTLDEKSLDTQSRLDDILANAKKLSSVKKRSLPADLDVARREYEAMLGKLLRGAGVPAGFTITPKSESNTNGVFLLAPKKPAYTRISFEIRLKSIDLTTLSKFLYDYYQLNLLHQITKLDIKRAAQDGSVGFRRGSLSDQRADLEVSITTEGIILDGAESRRSLLPIPPAVAAAAGGVGFYAISNTPEVARSIKPIQYPTLLATNNKDGLTPTRDYGVLAAKDPFHGPLPPPEKPKTVEKPKEVVVVAPPPAKPKEDISPFIRLNGMMWSSDGTVEATIWDKAFNHYYEIRSRIRDGKTEFKVVKFYMLGEKRKPFYSETDLIVGEDETATNRTFKIVGIVDDGIVLIDKTIAETPPVDAKPATATTRKPLEKSTVVSMNKTQLANTALAGGSSVALASPPPEKVYFWRVDQTLASLKALNTDDAKALLARVTQPVKTTLPTSAPLPDSSASQAQIVNAPTTNERIER